MILTAHQPVYLPWLGLFHKIALADMFVSFDQVQYQPNNWNNRNRIKTATETVWPTVPVLRKGYLEMKYCDIRINDALGWGRKHFNALHHGYGKAPYFAKYADFFEDTYARHWDTLVELNEYMLRWFMDTLGIRTAVRSAAEWDFRGTKGDLVLDMCRKTGATTFIFGALGRDYADAAAFARAGVKIVFQDYRHPRYAQQHGEFVSHLSIVDLLFNCGDDSLEILMSGNPSKADLQREFA